MFTNADEVLRCLGDNTVEFVDVRFCDLPGTVQHFTVPAESFGEKVFTDGLMFDGSSIRGFQQIHESDIQGTGQASSGLGSARRSHDDNHRP
jgi:glutamine synthetase